MQSGSSSSQSQSQSQPSSSLSSSGQTNSTRPAQYSDYEDPGSPEVDPVWGVLVPIKVRKFQTFQLTSLSHSFGRHPSNDFMFNKITHRLNRREFENMSKFQFVVRKNGIAATIVDRSSNGILVNSLRLPENRAVPLPHLAIISMAFPHNKCFQFYNRVHQKRQLDLVPPEFFKSYTLEDVILGTGGTCLVRKAFKNEDFNKKVAVKIIDKSNNNLRPDKDFTYEVNLVKTLVHPNIIKIHEIFENSHFAYIVMDFANEGNLCSYVQKNGALSEDKAKVWLLTIVKAIQYLHSENIIHRDIKPENILLHRDSDGITVLKLADFGVSRFCDVHSLCKSFVGTSGYWAPEVTLSTRGYSKEADLWSLGCLLYVLLVGRTPFVDKVVVPAALQHVMENEALLKVPLAKCLLVSLLQFNPKKRLKIDDALCHAWFTAADKDAKPSSSKRQRLNK